MSHERVDENVQDGPVVVRCRGFSGSRRQIGLTMRVAICAVAASSLAACGSAAQTTTSSSPVISIPIVEPTGPLPQSSEQVITDPTAPDEVISIPITIANITVAPADPVVSAPAGSTVGGTAAPVAVCPGATTIPGGVSIGTRIIGDIDGDGVQDTVTEYTAADGVPHVFLQRGGANASDVALAPGGSGPVSISWEDVDSSLGAEVAPPLIVLAITPGAPGMATATFLSPDPASGNGRCLAQWTANGKPFTFTIDQNGPFSGVLCDQASGRRYYVLRTATPDGLGGVHVTSREIDHDGIQVNLTPLGDESIPDDAAVQYNYGDIQNCDHAPIFASYPAVPFVTPTTLPETTTTLLDPSAATSTTTVAG
ncbi:MAG: hypothetical protein JWM34_2962 [Ilumatobacteraceae bacterium]|nr:hypothetical protein [Ilumatobacteraceae bacterium]